MPIRRKRELSAAGMASPKQDVCRCEEVRHEDTSPAECWLGRCSPVGIKRTCSDIDPSSSHSRFPCKSYEESRRADSNRLPLLQLRVIGHALQGFAWGCKSRISKPVSFLGLAPCCTVLRSRWYQIGINIASTLRFTGSDQPTAGLRSKCRRLKTLMEDRYLRHPCFRFPIC
jgi:hypothetical protein